MNGSLSPVSFEIIRNRMVAITDEMRIALQSVSGSPTVTESSDFFTGLFLPDGSVVSMGFQVAFQAPVSGTVIRHINSSAHLKVREGDMFIGNDPYIGALHQNDVQMLGPIYAGGRLIAWAGVQAHQIDVGGMDFASWCPKAKNVYQEGMRIPCVKLVDRGELREDVLEMIVTASRLPHVLGLDIRAFIATVNVAASRIAEVVSKYGVEVVEAAMSRMIESSATRMRARLAELPDGDYHACDFIEHDGHENRLYKIDCSLKKSGAELVLDYSASSKQSPGFINATRAGLMGGVCGSLLTSLAWDIQWNQGVLDAATVVAPDGLIVTAQFPAPVGAATVETVWSVSNATMLALNKLLAASPAYRRRAQGISDGCMATFNLGGINQFGEPFGLHLMDPAAGGSGAWASKDGINAGGPITSPVVSIADVEKNEQVSPLFYLYRRLAPDTGGPGKFRGGLAAEVALTLGGIERAEALIMTHGAEMPNSQGLAGGFPGSTVKQAFGRGSVEKGRLKGPAPQVLGPKPGLTDMTCRDLFAVTWQGGGGWGDPIERELQALGGDLACGAVSAEAAKEIYGVIVTGDGIDAAASERERKMIRERRAGRLVSDPDKFCKAKPLGSISESLLVARDGRGLHVVTAAGYILATGHTRWRSGAVAKCFDSLPPEYRITLHQELGVTAYFCPASGTLLGIDLHERGKIPPEDTLLDLPSFERLWEGCLTC